MNRAFEDQLLRREGLLIGMRNTAGSVPHLMARNLGYHDPRCGRWLIRYVDLDLFPGEIVACRFSEASALAVFFLILSGGKAPHEGCVSCNGQIPCDGDVSLIRTLQCDESLERNVALSRYSGEARYVIVDGGCFPDSGPLYRFFDNIAYAASTGKAGFLVGVPKGIQIPSGYSRAIDFDRLNAFAVRGSPLTRFILS